MIKAIVFDIGNVLADFCWEKMFQGFGLEGENFERIADATVRHPGWLELDRGTISTEAAIALFAKEAPEYRSYIERIYKDPTKMIEPLAYAIPWILELKEQGYHIYILSNWSKVAYEACLDKALNFLPLVDGVVFSFQEHVVKPEKKIFDILCERYAIAPYEAVFLDDSEKNVIAAREYGMQAIHFVSYEQAKAELEAILAE